MFVMSKFHKCETQKNQFTNNFVYVYYLSGYVHILYAYMHNVKLCTKSQQCH